MNSVELQALRQLAQLEGIQLSYDNTAGERQEASPETLLGVLAALGHPIAKARDLPDVLRNARQSLQQQPFEPVTVAWDGKPVCVPVRVPQSSAKREYRVRFEDGRLERLQIQERAHPGRQKTSRGKATESTSQLLALPPLPLGYHQLEAESADGTVQSLVISAPTRSYNESASGKRWGVFLPMYAAHSHRSWGAGNFGDGRTLSQWAGSLGGTVLASLPLLAAFLDGPTSEPSPYSPASRLFWNEFFLDIESIPEFLVSTQAQNLVKSALFQRQLAEFRRAREIDYPQQMRARRQVLEAMAKTLFSRPSSRLQEFQRFLRHRPQVRQYARFRAACDQSKSSWQSWSARQRHGVLRAADYSRDAEGYHAYVQWLAQRQIEQLVTAGRAAGVKLYLDLPLGVHPNGYDAWRQRDLFALKASAGAPPDAFFSKGQDWGFAPLHPHRLREDQYRYVLEYLRFQMRHTDLLRIDHVMGLHRLYWIPKGLPASQGAYVTYPANEWYALLCLESLRHKTVLVGENLGTVPPEVNRSMNRHGLRQMYVLQYEQRPDSRKPLRTPPRRSVASLNTHDMPTFAAHWRGKDLADRVRLGLIPKGQVTRERANRRRINAALVNFLRREGWLTTIRPTAAAVLRACLNWLSTGPAEFVLVNLEDLTLEELPQNVPGTGRERPNWRRKTPWTIEQIRDNAGIGRVLTDICRLRSGNPLRQSERTSWRKSIVSRGVKGTDGGGGGWTE